MNQLMCRACGEFVVAMRDGETLIPIPDSCRKCDGTVFKDIDSDSVVQTDAVASSEQ